jgi:hypothetical protein
MPRGSPPEVLAEVEALGYGAIWVGGSPDGDLGVIEGFLDATDHIAVATGILNVWKDDAATTDALVLHGDAETIGRGITAHLDAGADHVAIQILGPDPLPALRALADQLQLVRR